MRCFFTEKAYDVYDKQEDGFMLRNPMLQIRTLVLKQQRKLYEKFEFQFNERGHKAVALVGKISSKLQLRPDRNRPLSGRSSEKHKDHGHGPQSSFSSRS